MAVLAALLAGGLFAVYGTGLSEYRDVRRLYESAVEAARSPWFPAAFAAAYAAGSLIGFPTFLLSILAGVLYGVIPGALLALASGQAGAWAGYGVGRLLGDQARRQWMERHDGFARFEEGLRGHALLFVIQVRLIPLVPFAVSNYAFALLGCPFREFAIGTSIGMIPFTLLYAFVGKSLQASWDGQESLEEFQIWVSAALALLALLTAFLAARISRRRARP